VDDVANAVETDEADLAIRAVSKRWGESKIISDPRQVTTSRCCDVRSATPVAVLMRPAVPTRSRHDRSLAAPRGVRDPYNDPAGNEAKVCGSLQDVVTAFGKIGLVREVGTSWLLTRRLGYQRAYGLFVRGRPLEAMDAGLANELVEHDDLLPVALRWCERVTRLPDHVPAMTKTILRQAADLSWEQAIAMEEFAEPMCFTTEGHRAGVAALR
jgi:Enoyl-CoA hydratase/isomerase